MSKESKRSWNPTQRDQHRDRITNRIIIRLPAISPTIAGILFLSNRSPIRLKSSPSGAPIKKVSPPRAVRGDPQPGLSNKSVATAPNAVRENIRPNQPGVMCRGFFAADCVSTWSVTIQIHRVPATFAGAPRFLLRLTAR